MPIIGRRGQEIRTDKDWFNFAPPRGGERHWLPCRSALELARAWAGGDVGPAVPHELAQLLTPLLPAPGPHEWVAYPERRVQIDPLHGEPPNIDLAISFRRGDQNPLAVCVEAKAAESFGDEVYKKLTEAAWNLAHDISTNVVTRIRMLARNLLPPWNEGLAHLGQIRYQLLTGVAGTLAFAEAEGAEDAVFVVHEFVCARRVAAGALARNQQDLNQFVGRITGGGTLTLNAGELIGPIPVPGDVPHPRLFLGKIRRNLGVPHD